MSAPGEPVLSVRDLRTAFMTGHGPVEVVRGVDFDLAPGEVLGVLGESGSGKTMVARSLLRLLPTGATATAAALRYRGAELQTLDERAFAALRGRRFGMIFQDPAGAFNPVKRIGWHLRRAFARVAGITDGTQDWKRRAATALDAVGIPDAERVLALYPHQLSGGMLQRALIGMVLALKPDVIVADEPTTNLDNIVERQILGLFRTLKQSSGASFLFITHDIEVAASISDRIAVLYAGQVVEIGPTRAVLDAPTHPYTRLLVAASQEIAVTPARGATVRLTEMPGDPLGLLDALPPGCLFAPRCAKMIGRCQASVPPLHALSDGRTVRCVRVP
jgi:peptide/nickel transport system ATP-binding protein